MGDVGERDTTRANNTDLPLVRCLTLRQPWASLAVLGEKAIETRSWSTRYRGVLAIHASAMLHREDAALPGREPFRSALRAHGIDSREELPLGAVIGLCLLADCVPQTPALMEDLSERERAFGNYTEGRWAWLLASPYSLPEPIPATGRLGLWTPTGDLAARLEEFAAELYPQL